MVGSTTVLLALSPWLLVACAYKEIYPAVDPNASTTPLHLALMMSFGGGFNSSGTVPGIKIALDRVNADPSMLPGYTLHYTLLDSQCDHTVALQAFFRQVFDDPIKIGVLGAGCSLATEPTADVSHFYNLTQVSCASASPSLADRTRFRNYFQVLPTDPEMAPIFAALCVQYGWSHITIIQQDEKLFVETVNKVTEFLDMYNITYQTKLLQMGDDVMSLGDEIYENDARIIYLAMYSDNAREAICNAYKTGRTYPKYVFMTYAWYADEWWDAGGVDCTRSQMEQVLEFSLAVTPYPEIENRTMITDEGLTHETYDEEFTARQEAEGYIVNQENDQCFDAVWTIAFALNRTITDLATNATLNALAGSYVDDAAVATESGSGPPVYPSNFKIEQFAYDNSAVVDIMWRHLVQTDFLGITGPVQFDVDGIRTVSRLRVLQYRRQGGDSLIQQEIASVHIYHNGTLYFEYEPGQSDYTTFPNGIPNDGVPQNVTVSVHLVVTCVFGTVSLAMTLFAIVCLLFNLICRNRPTMRLTSPNLNYVIILGVVLINVSVFFYIMPAYSMSLQTIFCNVGPRLFALGYSLSFGTILAKMWRVYVIFTNPSAKKKSVKDWHLMLFVLAFVLVDLIILGFLSIYTGGRVEAMLVPNKERSRSEDEESQLIYDYYTYICESRDRDIWLGVVFGYKAFLQIVAIFLAFGTRKVSIKGLDDSKYIAMAIYVTSIVLAVVIIANVTLNDYINIYASLYSICLLSISTIIIFLVFLPKMYLLYKDPEGKTIFEKSASIHNPTGLLAVNLANKVEQEEMSDRITELEQVLSKNGISVPARRRNGQRLSLPLLAKLSSSMIEEKRSPSQLIPTSTNSPSHSGISPSTSKHGSLRRDGSSQLDDHTVKFSLDTLQEDSQV